MLEISTNVRNSATSSTTPRQLLDTVRGRYSHFTGVYTNFTGVCTSQPRMCPGVYTKPVFTDFFFIITVIWVQQPSIFYRAYLRFFFVLQSLFGPNLPRPRLVPFYFTVLPTYFDSKIQIINLQFCRSSGPPPSVSPVKKCRQIWKIRKKN